MAYLNVDLDYFDHPKTKRLIGLLGKGAAELPIRLWAYCGRYHYESGSLTGHSAQEIEALVNWWGAPGKCVEAFVKVGFLGPLEGQEGYQVHDWQEHQGHIAALRARGQAGAKKRWADMKASADALAMPQALLKHTPSNAPSVPTIPTKQQRQQKTEGSASNASEPPRQEPEKPSALTVAAPDDGFAAWYADYPNKVSRKAAEKAWAKLKPSPELQQTLRAAVAAQTAHRAAMAAAAQFYPNWANPATWLNGSRWEDVLTAPGAAAAPRGHAGAVHNDLAGPPTGEPYKPETPLQRLLCSYKLLKGLKHDDRAWDAAQWAQNAPDAARLLSAFDGKDRAAATWLETYAATRTKPDWNLRWAALAAWDTKGDRDAAAQREDHARLPRGHRAPTATVASGELVKTFLERGAHFAPEEN